MDSEIQLSISAASADGLVAFLKGPTSYVHLWQDAAKTIPIDLWDGPEDPTFDAWSLDDYPSAVWIDFAHPTATLELTLVLGYDSPSCGVQEVSSDSILVHGLSPAVGLLGFIPSPDSRGGILEIGGNPSGTGPGNAMFGGGDRFFPDARFVSASPPTVDAQGNNVVRVQALLRESRVGAKVYFRSFDVDDPSSHEDIDTNLGAGADNLGALDGEHLPASTGGSGYAGRLRVVNPDGTVGAWSGDGAMVAAEVRELPGFVVLPDGTLTKLVAEVELLTSFAPGDNFRVVAVPEFVVPPVWNSQAELQALSPSNDVPWQGTGDPTGALQGRIISLYGGAVTELLTVWRKLHVEQDRMQTLTVADRLQLQSLVVLETDNPFGTTKIQVTATVPEFSDGTEDDYQGGILRYGDEAFHVVYSVRRIPNKLDLLVLGSLQVPATPPSQFYVYQDDYSFTEQGHVRKVTAASNPLLDFATVTWKFDLSAIPSGNLINGWLLNPPENYYRIIAQNGNTITFEPRSGQPGPTFAQGAALYVFLPLPNADPSIVANPQDETVASQFYGYVNPGSDTNQNRFAAAYIEPDLGTLDQFDSVVTNQLQQYVRTGNPATALAELNNSRGAASLASRVFWTSYFTTGYEWRREEDADYNLMIFGGLPAVMGETLFPNPISIGFVEVTRDVWHNEDPDSHKSASLSELRARVGVHEIAHPLLGTAPPLDGEGHRNDEENIMHRDVDEVLGSYFDFAPGELRQLRKFLGVPSSP